MKRMLALLLAIITAFTLFPLQAMAANNDKLIALTFDDGPYPKNTQRLLDGLRERDVQCTFFVVGYLAETYPELIRQMWADGHQVATHTYDHPYLTDLSDAQVLNQLSRSDKILDNALGFDLTYMLRPPYGDYNSRVLKLANVPAFYWSMDTYDWKTDNADSTYREFIKQAKDGSLVLLHDSHASSVTAALRAIDTLKAQGYEFVTVSEMFYRRGITLENGQIYFSAYPGSYGTADGIAEPVITVERTNSGKTVTLNGDSRGCVYYTLNGEDPNPVNSTLYTGPFAVTSDTTVKAVSVLNWNGQVFWNGLKSKIVTDTVTYTPADAPVISIEDGKVTMNCATPDAVIRYTTDATWPFESAEAYTEPFDAVKGTTYIAVAYADGHDFSNTTVLTYSDEGNLFTDVLTSDWFYSVVDRAVAEGLFKGVSETCFEPYSAFTRGMLVTVLYRMAGEPEVEAEKYFSDVNEDDWYYDAVAWAYENKIVFGHEDGSFKPSDEVTREQLCAMLARYMRFAGKDLSLIEGSIDSFIDKDSIDPIFAEDVGILAALGIVLGNDDHSFGAVNGASRAEAAAMLVRMLDVIDSIPDVPQPEEPTEEGPVIEEPVIEEPVIED